MGLATMSNPNPSFWGGKRVLLTGHTGFKGSWLAFWLNRLGAEITGVSLVPATQPNLYELANVEVGIQSVIQDIRDPQALARIARQANPDIVLHLAAQPLVRASYRDPLGTFSTNVQGTANLLDALRGLDAPRVVIAITTDKVYRNLEQAFPFRETDPLGGRDPYSASKAAAELVVDCYRDAFFSQKPVAVASARAGNVIGGGDWSEDRLIPDAVRAWSTHRPLQVRRPEAIRPWQHVLEPLSAYLHLAERLWLDPALAGAYNFGPPTHEAASVRQVIEHARIAYGQGEVIWGDGSEGPHEAGWLTLETSKARTQLGIEPRWTLSQAVERTLHWYRDLAAGTSAQDLCLTDLNAYATSGKERCTP